MSIKDMAKRIKHNDLLPWFTDDHGQLSKAYLKSCQKFFDSLKAASFKQQATSLPQSPVRLQAKQKGKT
jgi:hypothetical protein